MLDLNFGRAISFSYRNEHLDPALEPTLGRNSLTTTEAQSIREHFITNGILCLHGHYPLNRFRDVFNEPPAITFVRDPIERLVSEYWFQVQSDDIKHTPEGLKAYRGEYSFEDYLRKMTESNVYAFYGLENDFDYFSFIGVTERFTESIQALKNKSAWLDTPKLDSHNTAKNAKPKLDPDLRSELESRIQTDVDIYREANKRLDHALRTS
jgi:hypothetical protein